MPCWRISTLAVRPQLVTARRVTYPLSHAERAAFDAIGASKDETIFPYCAGICAYGTAFKLGWPSQSLSGPRAGPSPLRTASSALHRARPGELAPGARLSTPEGLNPAGPGWALRNVDSTSATCDVCVARPGSLRRLPKAGRDLQWGDERGT